jgi:hypothetical protein
MVWSQKTQEKEAQSPNPPKVEPMPTTPVRFLGNRS